MSSIPPPKRERNAVETKKRLLDAAEEEFASKGFAGARLREVANAAGVQQALIHHYFADKEGLYQAVLDRAIAETTLGSWNILSRVSGFDSLLDAFVDLLLEFFSSHPHLLSIVRLDAASGSNTAVALLRDRTKPVFDAVKKIIEQLQRDQKIRADLPPDEIVIATLSMIIFPFQEARMLEALGPAVGHSPDQLALRKKVIFAFVSQGVGLATKG
ncbi:MAG: TetR/AcrR family transcriptional regulator [Polyangiaceae bacterium]